MWFLCPDDDQASQGDYGSCILSLRRWNPLPPAPQECNDAIVTWWGKPGLDRAPSWERSAGGMERAWPMQGIPKKREVSLSLRCGQAVLSTALQLTDEVRQPEPRASVSRHSFPLLQIPASSLWWGQQQGTGTRRGQARQSWTVGPARQGSCFLHLHPYATPRMVPDVNLHLINIC